MLISRGNNNPTQTATISIGAVNLSQNYFDVYIKNPASKVLAYEFNISGASILNVVSLVPSINYPETPDFLIGGNKVICISYKDSTIPKNVNAQPLCRVYYNNASSNICINSVVEIVNKDYESINKVLANNCITVTGLSQLLNKDHYFSVVPNPASDMIQLTGYTKSADKALVEIKDITGRVIYQEHIDISEVFNHTIYLNGYKSGVYYISISSKSGTATKPVVIVK